MQPTKCVLMRCSLIGQLNLYWSRVSLSREHSFLCCISALLWAVLWGATNHRPFLSWRIYTHIFITSSTLKVFFWLISTIHSWLLSFEQIYQCNSMCIVKNSFMLVTCLFLFNNVLCFLQTVTMMSLKLSTWPANTTFVWYRMEVGCVLSDLSPDWHSKTIKYVVLFGTILHLSLSQLANPHSL